MLSISNCFNWKCAAQNGVCFVCFGFFFIFLNDEGVKLCGGFDLVLNKADNLTAATETVLHMNFKH